MRPVTLFCALLAAAAADPAAAQQVCAVRGAWELESVTVDGQPQQLGGEYRDVKLVTARYWTYVTRQAGRAPLVTTADSLAAYRTRFFGGGTYSATDSSYTEHIEFFQNPEYIGQELTFSCRIEGDRWYHTGDYPRLQGGSQIGAVRIAEVWRRID